MNDRVFLTGATGFLGSHVARILADGGRAVACLRRSATVPRLLDGADIDYVRGDLNEAASYADALAGCGAVIHAAALSSFSETDPDAYRTVNTEGTRVLLEAAEAAGIDTFVYVGSRGTCGVATRPEESDEALPAADPSVFDEYMRSKLAAEELVLAAAERGPMRCCIVSPTALVGAYDEKPTPIGAIVRNAMAGNVKTYLDGGINIIDVEDAARGAVAALDKAKNGERYLLGTTNVTLLEMLRSIGRTVERRRLFVKIPYWAVYPGAVVLTALMEMLGRPSPVTPRKAFTLKHRHSWCSSRKAVEELGLPQTPVEETLRKAAAWFRENERKG